MDRREAVWRLACAAGSGALVALAPDELLALGARVHAGPAAARVLDAAQRRAAAVAADGIIPRTDTPGAADAGVVDFVDAMLAGWYAPAERVAVPRGLDALDAWARGAHGVPFARVAPAARNARLEALDAEAQAAVAASRRAAGGAAARGRDGLTELALAPHWFGAFKFLTVWGYCTSRAAMEQALGSWPMPGRYDADARVRLPRAAGGTGE